MRVSPVKQGLLALIRPPAGEVCHWLIVVSNWTPGSAQRQAASAICRHSSRARTILTTSPSVRRVSSHTPSFSSALRKSLGTRTELFEFWPETVW